MFGGKKEDIINKYGEEYKFLGHSGEQFAFSKLFPFLKKFKIHHSQLHNSKVIKPYKFLKKNPHIEILYRESVLTTLYNLPNAALPLVLRVLEISLKERYRALEKKEPNLTFMKLIEWAENRIGKEGADIAHGLRILRNYCTHSGGFIEIPDVLEAIRHTSKILEKIEPSPDIIVGQVPCSFCKKKIEIKTEKKKYYLTNVIKIECPYCLKETKYTVL